MNEEVFFDALVRAFQRPDEEFVVDERTSVAYDFARGEVTVRTMGSRVVRHRIPHGYSGECLWSALRGIARDERTSERR